MTSADVPYTPPSHGETGFNCPHCRAYSGQTWWRAIAAANNMQNRVVRSIAFSLCDRCGEDAVWKGAKLVLPQVLTVEPPHMNMPEDCRVDFEEARSIANLSPRGAAAILRLVVQKLMPHIGGKGENLNQDIADLVSKGLPEEIQMALDTCRVIGNNSVHPGEMAITDTPDITNQLFGIVNFIVDDRIRRPAALRAMYQTLPEGSRNAIAKRDGKE